MALPAMPSGGMSRVPTWNRQVGMKRLPVFAGTLRVPRHWENLLVDAAVIGGLDRWERRLAALEKKLALEIQHARL